MTKSSKRLAPSKAFFELFQVNGIVEIKAIIPCDLLQNLLVLDDDQINEIPKSILSGDLFIYFEDKLILTNSNGIGFKLLMVEKTGRDLDTKMMAFKLIYEKNNSPLKWVSNTFLFDQNVNHLNLHKLDEDEEEFEITSVENERFSLVNAKNNQLTWSVVIILILLIVAYGIYVVKI